MAKILDNNEVGAGTKIEAYDSHSISKPTYFKTTEFTLIFQLITDTYGIPTYQEANPTVISIVTFPFLFGMMFGDLGHGSILFMFSFFIVMAANKLKGTLLESLLPYRYIFLLMGLSSCYCGLLYNEWFAIPLNIFNSCYDIHNREMWTPSQNEEGKIEGEYTYLRRGFECVYPMGIDPAWSLARTKLNFSNNVKMKLSVIMGVVHMSIGIIIKGTNAVYFRRWADLFTEVCTGLIIFLGLFGWMCLLIFGKWFTKLDIEDKTMVNEGELYDKLN